MKKASSLFLCAISAAALILLSAAQSPLKADSSKPVTAKEQSDLLLQEGLNCLILDDNKKAEQMFIKAKSIDPYSEQAYNFLGLLYLQQGLYQKAEDMLKQAIAIEPMYPDALRNLGKLYLQQDRFKDAASCLKKTISLDINQPYTWYLLGMSQYFAGSPEEAVSSYETAFLMDSSLPVEARYNLAVAYHETGRYLEAVRAYEETLRQDPLHINAMNNLGLVYALLGDRNRAIAMFKRVLTIDKDNVKARINLGNAFLNERNLSEAEQVYRSAISLDSSDISPRLNLGVVFYEKGDFATAKKEWEALLKENPDNIRVLSVMGSAFLERREFNPAIDIFKRMADLLPDNGSIANTLGYLLADQNRELPLAKRLIEKAIKVDSPNRATYLDSLAWAEFRQGNFKKALKLQERAIKTFKLTHEPMSSEIHMHLGKIQEKLNNISLAKEAYRAAIKINSDKESVKIASESLSSLELGAQSASSRSTGKLKP